LNRPTKAINTLDDTPENETILKYIKYLEKAYDDEKEDAIRAHMARVDRDSRAPGGHHYSV
jgi:hypothetical protein